MTILTVRHRNNCLKMLNFFFEEMTANEDKEQAKSHIIKETLRLLSNEKVAQ